MFDIHSTTAPCFEISVDHDDFRISDINAACAACSQFRPEEQIGRRPRDFMPSQIAALLETHHRRCATERRPISYTVETVLPSGYTCWQTTLIPMVSPDTGRISTLVGVCIDTTAEKIAERVQMAFHEKVSIAMGALEGGFWTYDIETRRFEASRALTDLVAGPDHPLLEMAEYLGHIYPEDLAGFPDLEKDSSVDFRLLTYDQRTRFMHSRRRVVRDAAGTPVQLVAIVLDVTDSKLRQRRLEREAETDDLTGLTNRRGFGRMVEGQLTYPFDTAPSVALVLFDLDRFKPANDLHGHAAGDEVLRELGRRLRRISRTDTCARLGGDEFAILTGDGERGIRRVVERIDRIFAKPFSYKGKSIPIGASIGTAVRTRDDRRMADLMERADRELYMHKQERRRLTA